MQLSNGMCAQIVSCADSQ